MYFVKPIAPTDASLIMSTGKLIEIFTSAVGHRLLTQPGLATAYREYCTNDDIKLIQSAIDMQCQLPNHMDSGCENERFQIEAQNAALEAKRHDYFLGVVRRFVDMKKLSDIMCDSAVNHAPVHLAIMQKYELPNSAAVLNYKIGLKLG